MNPSLNYHASQARIEDMQRRSAQLQGIEPEKKIHARGRFVTAFASLTHKSPTWRPSAAPAADKA